MFVFDCAAVFVVAGRLGGRTGEDDGSFSWSTFRAERPGGTGETLVLRTCTGVILLELFVVSPKFIRSVGVASGTVGICYKNIT